MKINKKFNDFVYFTFPIFISWLEKVVTFSSFQVDIVIINILTCLINIFLKVK